MFHLHTGFKQADLSEINFDQIELLIRCQDLFVTLPSVIFDHDTERRKLYGKAGDYRSREIDNILVVELRTLGNNLFQEGQLVIYTFNQLLNAISYFNNCINSDEGFSKLLDNGDEIRRIINEHDKEAAYKMAEKFDIELPTIEVGFNSVVHKQEKQNSDETIHSATIRTLPSLNDKINEQANTEQYDDETYYGQFQNPFQYDY